MVNEEVGRARWLLEDRYVQIEVKSVNALQLKRDVLTQDIRDDACYGHVWLRSSSVLETRCRERRSIDGVRIIAPR